RPAPGERARSYASTQRAGDKRLVVVWNSTPFPSRHQLPSSSSSDSDTVTNSTGLVLKISSAALQSGHSTLWPSSASSSTSISAEHSGQCAIVHIPVPPLRKSIQFEPKCPARRNRIFARSRPPPCLSTFPAI